MAALDLILGPILVGTLINVFLFGIMVLQCYTYYLHYKTDKPVIKSVVAFLLLLDTISAIFDVVMTYDYLVTNFGNLDAISVANTGLDPYPVLTGVTSFVVQCFFGWRVFVLTKSMLLGIVICTLSTVAMLGGIGTTIGGTIVKQFVLLEEIKSISLIWLLGSVCADVVITVSLVWYLRKSRTGFLETDDILSRLIRATVQTGLLTSTGAIGTVIAYLASTSTLHLGFGLPLSKLYTNSLLSTLNMRGGWGFGDLTASHQTIHLSRLPPQSHTRNPSQQSRGESLNLRPMGPGPKTSISSRQPDDESESFAEQVVDLKAGF